MYAARGQEVRSGDFLLFNPTLHPIVHFGYHGVPRQ